MSIESAKAYVERMKNDEEFSKKILVCKDAKERMELVKTEGLTSLRKISRLYAAIDDSLLSQAAGGGGCWTWYGWQCDTGWNV